MILTIRKFFDSLNIQLPKYSRSILVLFLIFIFISGCQKFAPKFIDYSNKVSTEVMEIRSDYFLIAPMDAENWLVRIQKAGEPFANERLAIINIHEQTAHELPFPYYGEWITDEETGNSSYHKPIFPEGCINGQIRDVEVISSEELGFQYHCTLGEDTPNLAELRYFRWEYKRGLEGLEQVFVYPGIDWAGDNDLSLSSNLLWHSHGDLVNGKLYRIELSTGVKFEPVFPEFSRAIWPRLSPDETKVLFAGNEKIPSQIFTAWENGNMNPLFDYPWDIYLYDLPSNQTKKILRGIVDIHGLSWSPDGSYISFSGQVEKEKGVWIFDVREENLIKLWNEDLGYLWRDQNSLFLFPDAHFTGGNTKDIFILTVLENGRN